MNNITSEKKYICFRHQIYSAVEIYPISPCRAFCSKCKKKKVHGYSNPDHAPNPFGYCYLFPEICVDCADKGKKCMWCN